jgi:hypothetical protein
VEVEGEVGIKIKVCVPLTESIVRILLYWGKCGFYLIVLIEMIMDLRVGVDLSKIHQQNQAQVRNPNQHSTVLS